MSGSSVTRAEDFCASLFYVEAFLNEPQANHQDMITPILRQQVLTVCHHFDDKPAPEKIRAITALTRIKLADHLDGTEIQNLANEYVRTDKLDDQLDTKHDIPLLVLAAGHASINEPTQNLSNELLGYVAEKTKRPYLTLLEALNEYGATAQTAESQAVYKDMAQRLIQHAAGWTFEKDWFSAPERPPVNAGARPTTTPQPGTTTA